MLTRLTVDGFKNLVKVDIRFGPFTCIAGVNSAGKSNLFDAIHFLGALADMPLLDAALSVRSEGLRSSDLESIFHRDAAGAAREMSFMAEMLVPRHGVDDLGQPAKAAITFLRYKLTLRLQEGLLKIQDEELNHINVGDAARHLPFPHKRVWRHSVVDGRRTAEFISTKVKDGVTQILLHQDLGEGYSGGGRPRPHVADKLPRTVLSTANAAESSTAVLARRELQSWRLVQLEPSALRTPDEYAAPRSIAPNGAHLPATLARLARLDLRRHSPSISDQPNVEAEAMFARISNRLAELIEGVHSLRVDADDRRELLTVILRDLDGTEHEARSLSDGTLRFLALAVLESDPEARGVLCMEEPENGIHPQRIPAILRLLQDLSVDPDLEVGDDNPLRQVIVNTHSPAVAAQVPEDALLVALPQTIRRNGLSSRVPSFRWLPNTWRAKAMPESPTVPLGQVLTYLNPLVKPANTAETRRVVDHIQHLLPLFESSPAL